MRSFASNVALAAALALATALTLATAGCFSPAPADHVYRCATTSQCPSGYDCAGDGYCYRKGHLPMQSDPCTDHMQDGDETGVDCGGPTCPTRCPLDGACAGKSDCASTVSTACGQITCPCAAGQVCSGGACCTPAVCGRSCFPYDDGCGGTCPATFHCTVCCDTVCGTTKYGCP